MKKIRFFSVIIAIIMLLSLSACNILDLNNYNPSNGNPSNDKRISYDVSSSHFSLVTYRPYTYMDSNSDYRYVLRCTSSCTVSLYEYTADVKVYSSSNILLERKKISKTTSVKANDKFSFDVDISKQTQKATSSIEVTFSGKSYDKPEKIVQKYQVTFVYDDKYDSVTKVVVEEGKTVSMPPTPQKTNYIFNGWYTDSSFISRYDFSEAVTNNITLYAKYDIDAVTLTNKISTDLIKGVVKVYNKSYNTFLGFETSSSTSQGSGFCFYSKDGQYFILTNCHVAKKDSSYDKQKFTIEDYQGNTYEAYLYKNSNKLGKAIDPEYDLACLCFISYSTNVKPLSIASSNPRVDEDIISIGAPKGQSNSIAYGKIVDYRKVSLSDTPTSESNVTFNVICHDGYSNSGSSGGPLLNANLEVVGVHYASSKSTNKKYAIPAEKVKEFLNKYVYN